MVCSDYGFFMLALIYVTSAMLINKSGIIIASGFVGGFLGIVYRRGVCICGGLLISGRYRHI